MGRQKGHTAWNKGMKGLQPWMNISGLNKGEPWNKGGKLSAEHIEKLRIAKLGKPRAGNPENWKHTEEFKKRREGSGNPAWKGDMVGYVALHQFITKNLPKTELCQNCKLVPPRDLSNISQKYKREISDWEWLCRRCHMLKDGRLFSPRIKTGRKTTRELFALKKELSNLSLLKE